MKPYKTSDDARGYYLGEMSSGKYDFDKSFFNDKNGGFLLVHKGRKPSASDVEEMEVARAMAQDGLPVTMTPEGKIEFSTGFTSHKNPVYADGLVAGYSYEQATKNPQSHDPESLTKAVDQAIKHAYDKRAQIAVIYDRYGNFHQNDIDAGIRRFESRNSHRFECIITVNKRKEVHYWYHN